MANHTTPPFQVATAPPLEKHVLSPIESGGPICGVLIPRAVELCTTTYITTHHFLHHREVHKHGPNRSFWWREQRRRAPRTGAIELATEGADDYPA